MLTKIKTESDVNKLIGILFQNQTPDELSYDDVRVVTYYGIAADGNKSLELIYRGEELSISLVIKQHNKKAQIYEAHIVI